jgi:heat-inducible transcriptional repressor
VNTAEITTPNAAATPNAEGQPGVIPETSVANTAALDVRKSAILRAVVAEHIESGQPVGSAHLSAATGLGVSSATIRNEMSLLERDGYLTHPHTSAGRIPTDRGYRFFVDSLDGRARLGEPKFQQANQFFDTARTEIEQLLSETTRLLTGLTDYAAVAIAPPAEVATVRSVQVVGLGGAGKVLGTESALVVTVLSNGSIDKVHIDLPAHITEAQRNAATAHLNGNLQGRSFAQTGNHPSNTPLQKTGEATVDLVCDAAMAALQAHSRPETDAAGVFVGGTSRMVGAFDTIDAVRRVLSTLEEHYVVMNLLKDALDRSGSVSIGAEHAKDLAFESLLSCSVVVAPYHVDGLPVGTIGVLGPTRMDYPQAMAAVNAVSEGLSRRLTEG